MESLGRLAEQSRPSQTIQIIKGSSRVKDIAPSNNSVHYHIQQAEPTTFPPIQRLEA